MKKYLRIFAFTVMTLFGMGGTAVGEPVYGDASWVSMSPFSQAPDWFANKVVVDSAGSVYIGGTFTTLAGISASRVAKWNGSTWSPLGAGVQGVNALNGSVAALATIGTDLYVGGNFSNAGGSPASYVAKWNGSSWSPLGSGLNGEVYALLADGSDLYVGGRFTMAGGVAAHRIAKWDGTNWSAVGTGVGPDEQGTLVKSLLMKGGELYVGGNFTTAGGGTANRIAKWNGTAWSTLGTGMGNTSGTSVDTLVDYGGFLHAGGTFNSANGASIFNIARWTGSNWVALGSSVNSTVNSMTVWNGVLVVGGNFGAAGGSFGNRYLAKWDGSAWSAFGTGPSNAVYGLASQGSLLYAVGLFSQIDGDTTPRIAKFDGTDWSGLGMGTNGSFRAFAVDGDTVYAAGIFTQIGSTAVSRVAKWEGGTWTPLGAGINGSVNALVLMGGELYAGGNFTAAGGGAAAGIAKWNGTAWSPVGSGMGGASPIVNALATDGTFLYAGGSFLSAGGATANCIAKWDGTSWSALGAGLSNTVWALKVINGRLYAGGYFSSSGGSINLRGIGEWNGSTWSPLGSGMGSFDVGVFALEEYQGNLVAAGFFNSMGGASVSHVARWNGAGWSAMGTASSDQKALLAVGSQLFLGGVSGLVKWTGSAWQDTGIQGGLVDSYQRVFALAKDSGNRIFAGGEFRYGGTVESPYVIRADPLVIGPELVVEQPTGTTLATGTSRNFGTLAAGGEASLDFIIRNTGNEVMTLGVVIMAGPDASQFSFSANPPGILDVGASASFGVKFRPSTIGGKSAVLRITSNDADESMLDVTLSGTAEESLQPPSALPPVVNPSTGQPEQNVEIANSGTVAMGGLQLRIDGVPEGVTVVGGTYVPGAQPGSASLKGTKATPGYWLLEYTPVLPGGGSANVVVRYANTGGVVNFTPVISVQQPPPPGAADPNFSRATKSFLANPASGLAVLDFTTVPGRRYRIFHSADLVTWQPAGGEIFSRASSLNWTDDGSQTGSVPSRSQPRFYRAKDVTE